MGAVHVGMSATISWPWFSSVPLRGGIPPGDPLLWGSLDSFVSVLYQGRWSNGSSHQLLNTSVGKPAPECYHTLVWGLWCSQIHSWTEVTITRWCNNQLHELFSNAVIFINLFVGCVILSFYCLVCFVLFSPFLCRPAGVKEDWDLFMFSLFPFLSSIFSSPCPS